MRKVRLCNEEKCNLFSEFRVFFIGQPAHSSVSSNRNKNAGVVVYSRSCKQSHLNWFYYTRYNKTGRRMPCKRGHRHSELYPLNMRVPCNHFKAKDKVKKKRSNTLLTMIDDNTSSSGSDDQTIKIENIRSQTLSSSDEEEGNQSLNKKLVQCNHYKAKDKVKKKRSNTLLTMIDDNTSSSGSDDQTIKIENIRSQTLSSSDEEEGNQSLNKKLVQCNHYKPKDKVKKKRSNTLLTMIDDNTSSSGLDDRTIKIENIRSQTLSSSDEEDGNQSLNKKLIKYPSGKDQKFDLEEEARDLEEMISALEAEEQVPNETVQKLHHIRVTFRHTVPPQHQVETCAGSRGPTQKQKEMMEKFGPIKTGKFTPEEDDIIVKNWKAFCQMHEWDSRNVQPFLYMRHQNVGFVAKFTERQKFVQFLADGLPWRTLYSVYWRFRNLYRPHILTRYTEDEDRLIRAHMENASAIDTKNVRKFSELAKILNRTRASVWRRYQLLKKKRNPHNKRTQWDLNLIKKLIINLMKLTLSDDVHQLKDLDIPLVVWKKISEKLKIEDEVLKSFWLSKLHMQLFCGESVYLNDVRIKLIEYFYVKGITEWWEIEWSNVAKHFDGMTSKFLAKIFSQLVRNDKLEGLELTEVLERLYEVKRPELRKARTDKCLPRIVFKNGTLKLMEINANNQPKRKNVIEDCSD